MLDSGEWSVYSKRLNWQITKKSARLDDYFPEMRTDIILDNKLTGQRTVIDTKFNSLLKPVWHRDLTISSNYIYQMYTYLFSQIGSGDLMAENACGILLHPSVGEMVDEAVEMQGRTIRFVTVDLTASAIEIKEQLLALCRPPQFQ